MVPGLRYPGMKGLNTSRELQQHIRSELEVLKWWKRIVSDVIDVSVLENTSLPPPMDYGSILAGGDKGHAGRYASIQLRRLLLKTTTFHPLRQSCVSMAWHRALGELR